MQIRDVRLGRFVLALLACLVCIPASADKLKTDTSLAWAPSSVGFYFTMLDTGTTFDRFFASKAYARLKELPIVQLGLQQLESKWESDDVAELRDFLDDPENADLIQLFKDSWRNEMFVLGDKNLGKLIYLMNGFNRANQQAQIAMITGGDSDPEDAKNAMVENAIEAIEDMDVPNIIFGFKVNDSATAARQVERLAQLVKEEVEEESPDVVPMLKKRDIEGSPFAQISLTAEMIPWDEVMDNLDLTEEQVDRLKKATSNRSVHFTFGLHNDYFLFVVGSINNPVKLFKTKKLLYDRPEFAKLRSKADEDITSVSYASEDFMRNVSRPKEDIDSALGMAAALVPQAELEEDLEEDLQADIQELSDDIKSMIPEHGAVMAFNYRTDGGYESYTQNWAENLTLDGSQALDILSHLGGDPLFMFAFRAKEDAPGKGFVSKWFGKGISYAERFAMRDEPNEDMVEVYSSFKEALSPFGGKFAEATTNHLEPAMADRQVAFVFDSKLTGKTQWHPMMPQADQPLGMFEFAQVYGLADKGQLEKAFDQYRSIATEAIEKIKEVTQQNQQKLMENLEGQAQMLPMVVAQLKLPNAQTGDTDVGKLFFLSTLQQVGMDGALAPSMGWSDDVLVMTNTPDSAKRILSKSSLSGFLAEHKDDKLASASHVNLGGMMDTIKPWVTYGLNIAAEQQDNEMISMAIPQVETVFEVLGCLGVHSTITFVEDDSLVSFTRGEFTDLE